MRCIVDFATKSLIKFYCSINKFVSLCLRGKESENFNRNLFRQTHRIKA